VRLHFRLAAMLKLPHLSGFENDHPSPFSAIGQRFNAVP
jgi:hypothetical protein